MTDTATIFDIQRYCLHDGPGIRTTVFFKGCSLACAWCCNPESQSYSVEIGFHPHRCVRCESCIEACPHGSITMGENGIVIDRSRCQECHDKPCAAACPSRAIMTYGETWALPALLDEVSKDTVFFEQSGGGITASGGEPLYQPEFLAAFLTGCQERGFHTAIETCSHVRWEAFEPIIPHTDLFLCDVKHVDSQVFREHTGGDLDLILSNLRKLRGRTDQIIIRVPLIPGFNDDEATINTISEFTASLDLPEINLLPFHRLGKEKYASLNRPYDYAETKTQAAGKLKTLRGIPERLGLKTQIGG